MLFVSFAALAQGPTCGDIKSIFQDPNHACCGRDDNRPLGLTQQSNLSRIADKGSVCVTGCSPYTTPPFPTWSRMVNNMQADCALMIHVGDTKSGSGPCNDTLMAEPIRIMKRTGVPTLYALGDNEVTDCHRMISRSDMTSQGGQPGRAGYPIAAEFYTAESARTHMIRQFMTDPTTDITGNLPVSTQSTDCPFNVRVIQRGMLVTTIEMPGSAFGLSQETNMNLVDPYNTTLAADAWPHRTPDTTAHGSDGPHKSHWQMWYRANNCNLAWIDQSAQLANMAGLKTMIIAFHARFWTSPPSGGVSNAAYQPFYQKMVEVTTRYPDIMFYTVHADSHYWISFSPDNRQNWVNVMVEGGTRALTSFVKFGYDPLNDFDPLTVKEVHLRNEFTEPYSPYGDSD